MEIVSIICGIVFMVLALGGLLMVAGGIMIFKIPYRGRTYGEVCDVKEKGNSQIEITIEYTVNDDKYIHSETGRINPGGEGKSINDFMYKYHEGRKMLVYYKPNEPEKAYVWRKPVKGAALVGTIFMIIIGSYNAMTFVTTAYLFFTQ